MDVIPKAPRPHRPAGHAGVYLDAFEEKRRHRRRTSAGDRLRHAERLDRLRHGRECRCDVLAVSAKAHAIFGGLSLGADERQNEND